MAARTGVGHLTDNFCSRADLYCSQDHVAAAGLADDQSGRIVTPTEASELGRETWPDVSDVVTPEEPNGRQL